jgi:hypothetical protein
MSTSAWAEITADQVWQNWKALSQGYGQSLTVASEDRVGDTLTVTGVSLTSVAEGSETKASIDTIAFRERGDGTVEVTMSPQYPATLTLTDEEGRAVVVNVVVDQPGLTVVASGTDAETRYDIMAPTVNIGFSAPASEVAPTETQGQLALVGLAGNYVVTTDVRSRVSSALQADSARLTLAIVDPAPETGGTSNVNVNVTMLTSTTQGVLLSPSEMDDMSAALATGFSTDGTFGYSAADFSLESTGSTADGKASGTLGPGTLAVGLNKDRLAYGGTASNMNLSISGSGIPFPELVVSFTDSAFDFLMPVSRTEAPQDFGVLLRMVDLAVSDEVWAMFDPGAALPRDPATLVIDTTGKAKWLVDLFGPEAATLETAPGELHALDINELTLRAVGASVTGKGGFTFDNSDTTTFGGMPLPTGKLDLAITGANALLDRLSQTGLLPQDQVMGARMMMGLFARPGEGPDTLTSTLEFKDKGFFANGQQLQ